MCVLCYPRSSSSFDIRLLPNLPFSELNPHIKIRSERTNIEYNDSFEIRITRPYPRQQHRDRE